MVSIERLIDEHARISALANAILEAAAGEPATAVRAMIEALDGEITAHLATEDLEIYPHLLAAGDMAQREAAQIAIGDFDQLAAQWRAFADDWTEAEIAGDRELFVESGKQVISALAARIRIENDLLYPLALGCGTITLREAGVRVMKG